MHWIAIIIIILLLEHFVPVYAAFEGWRRRGLEAFVAGVGADGLFKGGEGAGVGAAGCFCEIGWVGGGWGLWFGFGLSGIYLGPFNALDLLYECDLQLMGCDSKGALFSVDILVKWGGVVFVIAVRCQDWKFD